MSEYEEYCEIELHESEIWNDMWDYMDCERDSYLLSKIKIHNIEAFFRQFATLKKPNYEFTDEESMGEDY